MQTTQSSEDASSLQQGASKHPILVAIAIVLTLALLPVVVYLDLRNLTSDALTNQAKDLGIVITDFRSYYTNSVIGKIQAAEGMAIPTHDYLNVKGGIPIPATLLQNDLSLAVFESVRPKTREHELIGRA